jgi:hypothetical protein
MTRTMTVPRDGCGETETERVVQTEVNGYSLHRDQARDADSLGGPSLEAASRLLGRLPTVAWELRPEYE